MGNSIVQPSPNPQAPDQYVRTPPPSPPRQYEPTDSPPAAPPLPTLPQRTLPTMPKPEELVRPIRIERSNTYPEGK